MLQLLTPVMQQEHFHCDQLFTHEDELVTWDKCFLFKFMFWWTLRVHVTYLFSRLVLMTRIPRLMSRQAHHAWSWWTHCPAICLLLSLPLWMDLTVNILML